MRRRLSRATRVLAVLVAALTISGGLAGTPPAFAAELTIVDSLGAATPSTTFSLFGSSGLGVFPGQVVGPMFTLAGDTRVTEIGAFLNMRLHPAELQIRGAVDGIPGPTILASLPMSNDGDWFTVSYESANPNLVLGAGSYFAFFVPQADDEGFVLGSATDPFDYLAGVATFAVLGSGQVFDTQGAVRILGDTGNPHDLLVSMLAFVDAGHLGPGTSLHDKLADALAYLEAGTAGAACRTLHAFENEVRAQAGKSLTLEQANALTADAAEVEALLGC
jgi:hypothetical protein